MKKLNVKRVVLTATVATSLVFGIGFTVGSHFDNTPIKDRVEWIEVEANMGDSVWSLVEQHNVADAKEVRLLTEMVEYSSDNKDSWKDGEFTIYAGQTVLIPVLNASDADTKLASKSE